MTERSEARIDLERRMREMIPSGSLSLDQKDPRATAAAAGVGGVIVGYLLGFVRGRRSRTSK